MPSRILNPLASLRGEARGGVLLAIAALLAMAAANLDAFEGLYRAFLATPLEIRMGGLALAKPLLLWINDGLMALFFLFVGLELKREAVEGSLRDPRVAALPMCAALGGVAVPVAIHVAITWGDPVALGGWAIPAATDIAFAVGVAALLGRFFPPGLRLFLLTLAIVDDLAAIVIIAAFYTSDLSTTALAAAGVALAALAAMNMAGVVRVAAYVVVGTVLWVAVLKSGVHATLAGVALGLAGPLKDRAGREGPAHRIEHDLAPWVTYAILPLFAFANAGVALAGVSFATLVAPLPLGVALGLFLGKQAGVMAAAAAAVALGLARLPPGTGWGTLYGAAILTGIGFTMSLFIGSLAFDSDADLDRMRLGVLAGSTLSAVWGAVWLRLVVGRGLDAARPVA
ncbi:MAG: Na+/H+ antiporter NhaA [Alphaproteobacteria bacterium]|nr:Na+/H+ antiporter NhaA [Alphaproteobacteria bacterium]